MTIAVGDRVTNGYIEGVVKAIDGGEAWVLVEKGTYKGHRLTYAVEDLSSNAADLMAARVFFNGNKKAA